MQKFWEGKVVCGRPGGHQLPESEGQEHITEIEEAFDESKAWCLRVPSEKLVFHVLQIYDSNAENEETD